jgi:hypothetical protein
MAYMVPPIHTDWPAVLAPEIIEDTSAALAAIDAATAPVQQTARMQQPVFSRLTEMARKQRTFKPSGTLSCVDWWLPAPLSEPQVSPGHGSWKCNRSVYHKNWGHTQLVTTSTDGQCELHGYILIFTLILSHILLH